MQILVYRNITNLMSYDRKILPSRCGIWSQTAILPPFRGVRYHLNEWGSNPVQNEKELFNLRHSSLRVTVERAFGALKRRFKILDDATPFFPFATQVDIVCACCIIHNWVIQDGHDEFFTEESNYPSYNHATKRIRQANEHDAMVTFRQCWGEGKDATLRSRPSLRPLV